MIRLGPSFLSRRPLGNAVGFPVQHTRQHTVATHPVANDVNLSHMVKLDSGRLLHQKVTHFPL